MCYEAVDFDTRLLALEKNALLIWYADKLWRV